MIAHQVGVVMRWTVRLAVLVLASSVGAQPSAQRPPAKLSPPGAITLFASVTDKAGRFVADLSADDFILRDDGKAQPITSVVLDASPMTLVLLIDRSGSMTPLLPQIQDLSLSVIERLQNGERMRLGQLDNKVVLAPADFSPDRVQLARVLRLLPKPGN